MFPRKALDLTILTILDKKSEGLTGYSMVNELKNNFPNIRFSPGTIYPKLKKLKKNGDISSLESDDSTYIITEQGKKRLAENTPDIIDTTLNFLPKLYKILIEGLPLDSRIHYVSHIPTRFLFDSGHLYDDKRFAEDCMCSSNISSSMKKLNLLKNNLIKSRELRKKKFEKEMEEIEKRLEMIEEKLEKCHKEKESWIKIPIMEEN